MSNIRRRLDALQERLQRDAGQGLDKSPRVQQAALDGLVAWYQEKWQGLDGLPDTREMVQVWTANLMKN